MGERYINLSDRQVKDTQNQSQDFLSVKTICRLLNKQDQQIADLETKLAEKEKEIEDLKQTKLLDDLHDASLTLLIGDKTRADLWALVEEHAMRELVLEERIKQEQNQTAIAELEKVKEYWLKHEDVGYFIDQQIKELKGE